VSLCCLSVTNPFRNKIIQLVAINPWFDRFILAVILVNCFFLALDGEIDIITANGDTIDFVFLLIYTGEMILKVIAMGFVMRAHSYLRDTWNIVSKSLAFDQFCIIARLFGCYTWMGFHLIGLTKYFRNQSYQASKTFKNNQLDAWYEQFGFDNSEQFTYHVRHLGAFLFHAYHVWNHIHPAFGWQT
jgi:hypothetical protein